MGATGSPVRASFHTYKQPKTLSSFFHSSSIEVCLPYAFRAHRASLCLGESSAKSTI
jgi:hypothetical protein